MAAKPQRKRKRAPARPLIAGVASLVKAGEPFRFAPGVSGNPTGRPSYAELSRAYRARLADQLDPAKARALKLPIGATVAEGIACVLAGAALDGDIAAAREICNRVEGCAPEFLGIATAARPKTEYTIRVVEEDPPERRNRRKEVLYDELVRLIENSEDEALIDAAASLAQTLKNGANARA